MEDSNKKSWELFVKHFCLTPRESEVFKRLIATEDNAQEIADSFYISRRCLQRHIASIYKKTGTKSRIGLFHIYINFMFGETDIR